MLYEPGTPNMPLNPSAPTFADLSQAIACIAARLGRDEYNTLCDACARQLKDDSQC